MIDQIKAVKLDYLNKLKGQKAALESTVNALISTKYATKKIEVAEKGKQLDEVFASFRADKLAKVNEEINIKATEVAEKKAKIDAEAKAQAELEANAEIAIQLNEYDAEIKKLEKELA